MGSKFVRTNHGRYECLPLLPEVRLDERLILLVLFLECYKPRRTIEVLPAIFTIIHLANDAGLENANDRQHRDDGQQDKKDEQYKGYGHFSQC